MLNSQHGERVLYAGMPDWRAEWVALFAILVFGLFWSAISFIFFGMSLGGLLGIVPFNSNGKPAGFGMNVFFFVFSLPFVAIGCRDAGGAISWHSQVASTRCTR